MNCETVIFDLDGTISDPFVGISRSVNYALEENGYAAVDENRIRPMIGLALTVIFRKFTGSVSESKMLSLVESYRQRYASVGYQENQVYEEIPELVTSLADTGYSLGVCTSKRADYALKIVEMFGLTNFFEFVDGGDIHVTKTTQLERLIANGLNAESATMIGDRWIDIEAARKNGMTSIGVRWGFGDDKELTRANPDHLVTTPAELLELFS